MALSLQDPHLVWQKVKKATANANPSVQAAFRELKTYLATQGGNPQLQFIPFGEADIIQATGYSPIGNVTSTVYGAFAKKVGAGAGVAPTGTDSMLTLQNATTNTDVTKILVALVMDVANAEVVAIKPTGWIFATDLTISGQTAALDGTESTANDSGGGFVIVGA